MFYIINLFNLKIQWMYSIVVKHSMILTKTLCTIEKYQQLKIT